MTKIRLNSEIYSENNVKLAVEAYCELARIQVDIQGEYYILQIEDTKYDESRTVKEFENYLVGLENM